MDKKLIESIIKNSIQLNSFTYVGISKEKIYINDVFDIVGNKIFNNTENYQGYLIFINPYNFANWSHKCMYWFITDARDIMKNDDCEWYPNIELEKFI